MMDMLTEINFDDNREYVLIRFVVKPPKIKRKKEIFTNSSLVILYSHFTRRAPSSDRHMDEKVKLNLLYVKFFWLIDLAIPRYVILFLGIW